MWPDDIIKSSPRVDQKLVRSVYTYKVTLFKWVKKSQDMWATFEGTNFTKTFKQQPNLVPVQTSFWSFGKPLLVYKYFMRSAIISLVSSFGIVFRMIRTPRFRTFSATFSGIFPPLFKIFSRLVSGINLFPLVLFYKQRIFVIYVLLPIQSQPCMDWLFFYILVFSWTNNGNNHYYNW